MPLDSVTIQRLFAISRWYRRQPSTRDGLTETKIELVLIDLKDVGGVVEPGRPMHPRYAANLGSPNLLSEVKNDHGGKTRVTYKPSSDWHNDKLPLVLQTVSAIELDDGRGTTSPTLFSYSGGQYDSVERRFLGFRNARAQLPCNSFETMCPERYYTFQQDLASAGLVKEIESWTGPKPGVAAPTGIKLRHETHTWQVNTTSLPYWARDVQTDHVELDISGSNKTSRIYRTFDAFDNITRRQEAGDINDPKPPTAPMATVPPRPAPTSRPRATSASAATRKAACSTSTQGFTTRQACRF